MMIKIISTGGNARGIQVTQDGVEIKGIIRLVINPIEALGPVTATITVLCEDLDIEAHDTMVLSGGGEEDVGEKQRVAEFCDHIESVAVSLGARKGADCE